MNRYRKLSDTIWHCQYYMAWLPKYRFENSWRCCLYRDWKRY